MLPLPNRRPSCRRTAGKSPTNAAFTSARPDGGKLMLADELRQTLRATGADESYRGRQTPSSRPAALPSGTSARAQAPIDDPAGRKPATGCSRATGRTELRGRGHHGAEGDHHPARGERAGQPPVLHPDRLLGTRSPAPTSLLCSFGNGRVSELQRNNASYTGTITPTASGPVAVDIPAGAAQDSVRNPSPAADQSSVTADLTPVPALPVTEANATTLSMALAPAPPALPTDAIVIRAWIGQFARLRSSRCRPAPRAHTTPTRSPRIAGAVPFQLAPPPPGLFTGRHRRQVCRQKPLTTDLFVHVVQVL